MVAISSVLGAVSALPSIVAGVDSVVDFLGGIFGGSTATPGIAPGTPQTGFGSPFGQQGIAQAGTSVGPMIDVGIAAIPAIATAVSTVLATRPVTGFGSPFGQTNIARPLPVGGIVRPGPGGVQTMTRKQFILATARAFSPGATAKKIIRSARQCGIELAAATFGLNVLDVCFLIAQPATRRSRGISAADIRRTRSTMRKVNSLKNLCPPARRSRK